MTAPHFSQDAADPLLTTREASVKLGVSLRTVQLWVDAGTLVAGRTPGGHRRIRTSAVIALSARCGITKAQETSPVDVVIAGLQTLNTALVQSLRNLVAEVQDHSPAMVQARAVLAQADALMGSTS